MPRSRPVCVWQVAPSPLAFPSRKGALYDLTLSPRVVHFTRAVATSVKPLCFTRAVRPFCRPPLGCSGLGGG